MSAHTIAPPGKHHHPSTRTAALGVAGLGLALGAAFGISTLISGEEAATVPGSGSQSGVSGGGADFNGAPRYWENRSDPVNQGSGLSRHPRQG